jgi:hypothetical protein
MKRLVIWTAVLALTSPLGCGGNDSGGIGGDEIVGEAPDVAAGPGEASRREREAYVAEAERSLDDLEREIGELRQDAANAETADELELTRERAEARLEELKDAEETEWRRIRAELQQMIDDLKVRYDQATATG